MAVQCYLDLQIGDLKKHEQDVAAHERAQGFFSQVAAQV